MSNKPAFSKENIKNIAHLARIAIDDNDIAKYASDLSHTIDLITNMSRVNTEAVVPMAHPIDFTQRFRADRVGETNQRERFQKLSPQVEAGLYLVPKVIE